MREWIARFMQGRYGVDKFSNFLFVLALICLIVEFFVPVAVVRNILNLAALLILVYSYCRIFSKNHAKRYAENERFMKCFGSLQRLFHKKQSDRMQKRYHRIFKCPNCRQSVRVPKGKGKIAITCPKCRTEFIRRS